MSTLPLSFKVRNAVIERHQLEGTDPSDRYFNRAVPVKRVDRGYQAKVVYEALVIESGTHSTIAAAVKDVVDHLSDLGFHKIRTRLNFRGQRYMAEKESWIDYPD